MSSTPDSSGKSIVVGVSGGIAAFKVCTLVRQLKEAGHDVTVVPTEAALNFVGAATWAALSGHEVMTDVWTDVASVGHVRIGQNADLVIVAPATADLLAKAAAGFANDLLTNVLLTARCPVVMAPAMHTEMWEHAATQANVATLRDRGVTIIDPAVGRLTGADSGAGRLVEPGELAAICELVLDSGAPARDLVGRRVVISAGGTREALDPVRFLGNRSSGLQGWALARTARLRGAHVTVVAASTAADVPVNQVYVESARELQTAIERESTGADVVVMAAAVADFRPAEVAADKIKKDATGGAPTVELVRNPDILAGLVATRASGQILVGFAAETGDADGSVMEHGRRKLESKGCDLLVVNDVSGDRVFGQSSNEVAVLGRDGSATEVARATKDVVANVIWDRVSALLG